MYNPSIRTAIYKNVRESYPESGLECISLWQLPDRQCIRELFLEGNLPPDGMTAAQHGVLTMGPARVQKGFLQILPMLGAALVAWSSVATAQESFPNELNSPVDEPQVIVREQSDKVPVRPASQEIQQSTDPLVKLAWETREATRRRLLSTAQHTPWQMMHGLLGLRHDFLISHDGAAVNGLEWIRTGPMYQNEPWFQKTVHGGRAHPFSKPYWFEGHINQSLAILSQCELPLDTTFGTPDGTITMRDMLKNAQMTVNEKEEVTWTLWALCTYLPPDAKWMNAKGEQWSIERLVQVEVGKPVGGPTSPCGGTHGLYALARARNIYMATGKPLRGVWYQADQKIKKYIQISKNNQNANGTLSSAFFKGKEYKQDFDKRMASTGHQLEFLMMAVDDRTLREPWLRRAVEATANDLMANRKEFVSCSPLYHATNALTLYLERAVPSQRQQNIAQRPTAKTISNSKELTQTPPAQSGPGTVPPVPKVAAAPSTNVKAATAGSTTSGTSPGTASAAMPQVAPALKSTPSIETSVTPPTPATSDKSPSSGTAPAAEKNGSSDPKPRTVENPLTPVPLPDLTIPAEPSKSADATTKDSAPPQPAPSGTPEILPKAELPSPTPGAQVPASPGPAGQPTGTPPSSAEAVPPAPMSVATTSTVSEPAKNATPAPSAASSTPEISIAASSDSSKPTEPAMAAESVTSAAPTKETGTEPVVSAERPEHPEESSSVIPLLAPVPLRKVPTDVVPRPTTTEPPAPGKVPVKSVSSSRVVTPATPANGQSPGATEAPVATASSPTVVLPAGSNPDAPKGATPEGSVDAGNKRSEDNPEKKPSEKHRWKATPIERRRVTIQSDVKTSG